MRILAEGLRFPEGPIAMPDGSVLLVEIERQTLSRVQPDGRVEVVAAVPGGPNGAALAPDGRRVLVCNNGGMEWVREGSRLRPHGVPAAYAGGSIDVVDLASGAVSRLYDTCEGHRLSSPNDLVVDAHGGFYFTDIGKRRERDMDRGFVYWARLDGSEIRAVTGPMLTPNGVGLSPDGSRLYVAETDTGRLWVFDVTGPGALRRMPWPSPNGGRAVVTLPGYGRFDSLAVTASGRVCVAAVEGCGIAEIDPESGHVRMHHLPDLLVTNLCFGGQDRRTVYVTLSHGGSLMAMDWHEPGLVLAHEKP